ncbi:MAG: hypothetical protein EZS28_012355 [Streblomastix strix]|uniref:Uncharacterized protein n=1 Tax=Streblomastix strix TaxID=222440 RepID=A0A5J4WBE1_9EUKA|nr:MAG: hypothetical protein EZS28_012355 [Streblomastix strix]
MLTNPTEWDDALTCISCTECGSPMREIRTAQVQNEIEKRNKRKMKQQQKQEQKNNKSKDDEDDIFEEDKDNSPLNQLLDHIERQSTIPDGQEIEQGLLTSYELEVEEEMAELDNDDLRTEDEIEKDEAIKRREERIKKKEEEQEQEEEDDDDDDDEDDEDEEQEDEADKDDKDDDGEEINNENEEINNENEKEDKNENKDDQIKDQLKQSLHNKSKFSNNLCDYSSVLICRHYPTQHHIIAGKRLFLLTRRASRAYSKAVELEVSAESGYGKGRGRMPSGQLLHSLTILGRFVHVFRRILHPFHETMIQSLYGQCLLIFTCFVESSILTDFCNIDDRLLIVNKDIKENNDDKELRTKTLRRLFDSQGLQVILSPSIAPNKVISLARYTAQMTCSLYYPSCPRRVLDLKMSGILLILMAQDAPNQTDRSKMTKQWCTYEEGMTLLKQSLDEGLKCYGAGHCEIVELENWIQGGWQDFLCWEKRMKALELMHMEHSGQNWA